MLALGACTKPQITFQNISAGGNQTNVLSVDTFTVKMSTVFLDSFKTSGTNAQLLGRYIDPYFGAITSRSFTEIGVPSPIPTLTNFSVYDSIELILRIDKSFYGDTTKIQRFLVSQLTQTIDLPGTQTVFYNKNFIPYDPAILGSASVVINPTAGLTSQRKGDSVKIAISNTLGQQLFGLVYRQPDTLLNSSIFRGFFKGLTVYPDTTLPGAMYGFKDSLLLRIFYHEPGVTVVQKTIDFNIINPGFQFNNITVDRTGTPTAPLSAANVELPSALSGNQAFLQPITSLYTKLLFPTIGSLQGYPDYLAVMKAELYIKPVQGSYSPIYPLPPQIQLAQTTQANTIGTPYVPGTGSLVVDYLYGTNTAYTYDVTGYIQSALAQGPVNNAKNGLILIAPNLTFNRAVFGDAFNPQKSNQIYLKIYYASYY